jgi:hypothetical protein
MATVHPVSDPLSPAEVLKIDMVETLIPCFPTLAVKRNNLPTEAAPKSGLSIFAHTVIRDRNSHRFIFDVMMGFQMLHEDLLTIIPPHVSLPLGRIAQGTVPALDVIMLRVLVPFPVRLAAECLAALRECATIGSLVAFLVFPSARGLEDDRAVRKVNTNFISHRKRVRFAQTPHWIQSFLSGSRSFTFDVLSPDGSCFSDRQSNAAVKIRWRISFFGLHSSVLGPVSSST